MSTRPVIQEFFARYTRSRNTFDADLIDSLYPDAFMFAGPGGARVVEKAAVLAGLPKGQASLTTLGHAATRLDSLHETILDEHYTMVRGRFVWRFEKPSAIDVEVETTFILFMKAGAPEIVFQQEREDFQHLLRARGVLPGHV